LRGPPVSTLFPYTTLFRSHRVAQWQRLRELRADVHIGADDLEAAQAGGLLVGGERMGVRDAELRALEAGGDVLVRLRVHVGIHEIGRAHVSTPVTFRSRMP